MSSNATLALALRDTPQAVVLTSPQIQVIANTEFVPRSMRGDVPKVLACIARGRAMGIPDMVAINGIDIIQGKATLSAELMVAIVREHGHSITGDVTATAATVRGKRRDNGDTMTAEFNLDMATAAGLLGKENWKKHPDDMMWARAVSKLCRRLFADCFAGGTYSEEDLSDSEVTVEEIADDPAGWAAGTATEPEKAAGGSPPPDVPEGSGSVTALDHLRQDFTDEEIGHTGGAMFPGRSARSLTEDEISELRVALQQTTLEGVEA